jgi:glycosyltransferase involved in cell wall biosynthesis
MHEVSVVIPTRNRSRLLALTLRSVLSQRGVELDVVVVDEASTDDTAEVIARINDPRVRVVRHDTPVGVAAARTRGWQEARAGWIAFVDDDDLWAPPKLALQLSAACESGRHWAYVGVINIDEHGRIVSGKPPPPPEQIVQLLPTYNAIPGGGSNVVARRALLDAVGQFDVRHHNTEDWEMWLRLARRGPPAWVPQPLLAYRLHTKNASLNIEAILRGAALIQHEHAARVDYGMLHRWFAESSLRQGRRAAAMRHLIVAAAHGQAVGVAADTLAVARRRIGRVRSGLGKRAPLSSKTMDPWCAQAHWWLDELGRGSS